MSEVTDLKEQVDASKRSLETAAAQRWSPARFGELQSAHRMLELRYQEAVRRDEAQRALESAPDHDAVRARYDECIAFVRGGYEKALRPRLAEQARLIVDALLAFDTAPVIAELHARAGEAARLSRRLSLTELGVPDNGSSELARYERHEDNLQTIGDRACVRVAGALREELGRAAAARGVKNLDSLLAIVGIER